MEMAPILAACWYEPGMGLEEVPQRLRCRKCDARGPHVVPVPQVRKRRFVAGFI